MVWLSVALAALAACADPPRPTPDAGASDADLILRDVGPLRLDPRRRIHAEPILPGSRRARHPDDRQVGALYDDAARQISVDVTIESFGDRGGLLHELEGNFREGSRETFPASVTIVDAGARRRFELRMSGTDTHLVVAWPAAGNKLVQVDFTAAGPGRLDEMPMELVEAYLALHPSVLPATVADTPAHHEAWIRREMEFLLAYAERDLRRADDADDARRGYWTRRAQGMLVEFAGHRERTFGEGSEAAFKRRLREVELRSWAKLTSHLDDDDGWRIDWLEDRLAEFRRWWQAHRDDPVRRVARIS